MGGQVQQAQGTVQGERGPRVVGVPVLCFASRRMMWLHVLSAFSSCMAYWIETDVGLHPIRFGAMQHELHVSANQIHTPMA